jgi:hypothetical protein
MITVSDGYDLGENLAIQAMTNFAERSSLGENRILKGQLKGRLMLSDGGQILVPTSSSWSTVPVTWARMRAQPITVSLRRSPVVANRPKNVPERPRPRYAGRDRPINRFSFFLTLPPLSFQPAAPCQTLCPRLILRI